MAKFIIDVPSGLREWIRRELVYEGIRRKPEGGITVTLTGTNDEVEFDDTVYDAADRISIATVVGRHNTAAVAPFADDPALDGNFIVDEVARLDVMSPGNRRQEDFEELIIVVKHLGPEALTDLFLTT